MRKLTMLLICFISLSACKSGNVLKDPVATSSPSLGTLVQEDRSIFKKHWKPVGVPVYTETIALKLTKISKNKLEHRSAIDSLKNSAYLFNLDIADKVRLTALLNDEEHKDMRDYWALSEDHGIVSEISFYAKEDVAQQLINADYIFLSSDDQGKPVIVIHKAKEEFTLKLSPDAITNYAVLMACWEMDTYGNLVLVALNKSGEQCPQGTVDKKSKMNNKKPYLKF